MGAAATGGMTPGAGAPADGRRRKSATTAIASRKNTTDVAGRTTGDGARLGTGIQNRNEQDHTMSAADKAKKKVRGRFTLTDAGDVDVSSMDPKTRAAFRRALKDDAVRAALGESTPAADGAPAASAAPSMGALFLARNLYGLLGLAQAGAAVRFFDIPAAIALDELMYTERDLEQLAPLTAPVIEKYLPMAGDHHLEVALALAVLGVLSQKVATVQTRVEQLAARRPRVVPLATPAADDAAPVTADELRARVRAADARPIAVEWPTTAGADAPPDAAADAG
jgi:hypothetical protein